MRFSLLLMCLLFSGCNLTLAPSNLPTLFPTPSPTPTADGWDTVAQGLEQRTYLTPDQYVYQTIRIDPAYYTFRAHYRPGELLTLNEWREVLPGAAVIVNANFFTTENTVLGLLISDGVVYGQSFVDNGATFFVENGVPGIRSNLRQPYRGEPYEQAVQAFPNLVIDGEAAYNNSNDYRPSRRTIVGQDRQGRIVLMVTPGFGPGLYNVSQYLPTTDIGFVNAFNLDGGGSTMMYVAPVEYVLRSIDPVPAVLAAYPR
jgi:hypothetical protein